jgi:predicted membrane protein
MTVRQTPHHLQRRFYKASIRDVIQIPIIIAIAVLVGNEINSYRGELGSLALTLLIVVLWVVGLTMIFAIYLYSSFLLYMRGRAIRHLMMYGEKLEGKIIEAQKEYAKFSYVYSGGYEYYTVTVDAVNSQGDQLTLTSDRLADLGMLPSMVGTYAPIEVPTSATFRHHEVYVNVYFDKTNLKRYFIDIDSVTNKTSAL